jgi:hypothetical protein
VQIIRIVEVSGFGRIETPEPAIERLKRVTESRRADRAWTSAQLTTDRSPDLHINDIDRCGAIQLNRAEIDGHHQTEKKGSNESVTVAGELDEPSRLRSDE